MAGWPEQQRAQGLLLRQGLVFCRQWVGIPIPTEDYLLASFKSMPKLNEDEQKAAPEIQSWKHRLDIATQPPLTRLRMGVQDSLQLAVSSSQMAHSGRARSQQEKSTARMQVWHILRGKDKTPFFVSTPTHTVPQEPRFESLQEDLDILFGAEPPVFPPRLLALKDGIAEVDKGKCTHTLLHTFTRANLHLHPLSLSDRAAEVVSGQDRRDSSGNWRRTPGSGRREPSHERYSSGRPKSSNETKTIILTAPNYLHMHDPKVILREAATSTSWGADCEQPPVLVDPEVPSDSSWSNPGESSTKPDDSSQQRPMLSSPSGTAMAVPPMGMVHFAQRQGILIQTGIQKINGARHSRGTSTLTTKPWCPQCMLGTYSSAAKRAGGTLLQTCIQEVNSARHWSKNERS